MIDIKYITREQGYRAYYNTSFTPDKRGEQIEKEYREEMERTVESLKRQGLWIQENADIIQSCFDKYYELYCTWLYKMSQCMSSMITGPSKFPVRKNRKKLGAENRALIELNSFSIETETKRRLRKRQKNQETKERVESGEFKSEVILEGKGYKVVNNKALERIQILFDEKPSEEIRQKLKDNAFRWSPKNKTWQRKNTSNGLYAAKHVIKGICGGEG